MVLAEMKLQRVVVNIILLLAALVQSIANVAPLVLVSAMCVQLVIAVESLPTKPALRMAPEAALVDGPRIVVSKLLMLFEFTKSEEFVLMCEDLLISCA